MLHWESKARTRRRSLCLVAQARPCSREAGTTDESTSRSWPDGRQSICRGFPPRIGTAISPPRVGLRVANSGSRVRVVGLSIRFGNARRIVGTVLLDYDDPGPSGIP